MEAELENYQFQLSQVSIALEADPTNAELTALKVELEEIIALTKEALGVSRETQAKTQASTSSASVANQPSKGKAKESAASNSKNFRAGDEVIARYKDGKWYSARVTVVSGSADAPLYTIVFKGWNTPTTLPASLLRPVGSDDPSQSSGFKRKTVEDEREKEKRKKKNEKWQEVKAAKTAETNEKKNAWEKFGKKATKKGVKIGGLEGKSIFRTPDNPHGKGMVWQSLLRKTAG
ncbi:hypothetical protein QFC20_001813 [Naganishia adeliensis]|uniref:Uncharacterized protein n=1 Tax=Naganishia adeliensis TaxID=92952 RepID=A0ACC2WSJ7_9TREE|nr:hypothetical protein QFC20_001813 [Naganishia adeliensis]